MREELFATLGRVGITDESVELENVTLNREQNMLTVFFRCANEPPMDLTKKLMDELESRLGGPRVRVEWLSDIKRAQIAAEENDTPLPSIAAAPVKAAPKGKRIMPVTWSIPD